MSMWSDFYGDHVYEIEHDGVDPNELYWKTILGIKKRSTQQNNKRKDGYFSINDKKLDNQKIIDCLKNN